MTYARVIADLGDVLLFVATDRVSAFDVILPNLIPGKGQLLTQISLSPLESSEGTLVIAAIRDVCSLPIVAQMTVGTDGRTIFGDVPKTWADISASRHDLGYAPARVELITPARRDIGARCAQRRD